jgi:hypothetical protein
MGSRLDWEVTGSRPATKGALMSYEHGRFVWFELVTKDIDRAVSFYPRTPKHPSRSTRRCSVTP